MPYLTQDRNCFKCEHLGASETGYICNKGFRDFRGRDGTRTIWTGDLARICPLYEERVRPALGPATPT